MQLCILATHSHFALTLMSKLNITTKSRRTPSVPDLSGWFTIRSSKGLMHGAMSWWNRDRDPRLYVKTFCAKNLAQGERGPADSSILTCSQCLRAISSSQGHIQ